MRGFGLLGVIGALIIAGIAGTIGYQIGLSTEIAESGGAVVVAPWGAGFGWGFPFFGFLLFILFIVLIGSVARRAASGSHGYGAGPWGWRGGYRSGAWGREHGSSEDRPVPPFVDAMLADWHRQAHDGATTRGSAETGTGTSGPTPTGA